MTRIDSMQYFSNSPMTRAESMEYFSNPALVGLNGDARANFPFPFSIKEVSTEGVDEEENDAATGGNEGRGSGGEPPVVRSSLMHEVEKQLSNAHAHSSRTATAVNATLSLTQSAKALVSFAQILLVFQPAFRLAAPPELVAFLGYLRFIALEIFSLVSPGCLFQADFIDTLAFVCLAPVAASMLAFLVERCQHRMSRVRFLQEKISFCNYPRHFALPFSLALSFVMYTAISIKLFRFFDCETFEDGRVTMVVDPSVACEGSIPATADSSSHDSGAKYEAAKPFVYAMIVLYPVGIPLVYFWLLSIHREKIKKEKLRRLAMGAMDLSGIATTRPQRGGAAAAAAAQRTRTATIVSCSLNSRNRFTEGSKRLIAIGHLHRENAFFHMH